MLLFTPTDAADEDLLGRAAGTVLAGAVGDALGAGYEFSPAVDPDVVTMLPGTLTGEPAGYWTDDTAMAVAILEVAAREGTLTTPAAVAAVGARFLEWFSSRPPDIGNHTRAVLSRAATGADLTAVAADVQARNPSSASNGSLMRTGPVALAHLGDDAQLVAAATAMSELTHAHPDAVAACVLWTVAIDRAVRLSSLEGPRAGLHLIDASRRAYWEDKLTEAETHDPRYFTDNGHVVVTLQAAWASICATRGAPNHLVVGLRQAVAIGGDTDTVAAIAGYLLGARYGISSVPLEWRHGLSGWPRGYVAEDLVRLAGAAVRASAHPHLP